MVPAPNDKAEQTVTPMMMNVPTVSNTGIGRLGTGIAACAQNESNTDYADLPS